MTVAELIKELSAYPSDLRVVVDGYEGGLDDTHVAEVAALLDQHTEGYLGTHEECYYPFGDPRTPPNAVRCVYLPRGSFGP